MSKPLPAPLTLIRDTWSFFAKHWNDSIKISIWFLYAGVLQFLASLLFIYAPSLTVLGIMLILGTIVMVFWTSIRLMRATLGMDAGKKIDLSPDEWRASARLMLPLLWVGILNILIVLGGTLLFIIPGIYLSVLLTFGGLILLSENKRGIAALQASRELVQGRWWATFGRFFLSGLIFGIAIGVISGILSFLLATLVGPGLGTGKNPLLDAAFQLLSMIIQAAVIPLFVAFQVKMFHALKATR